VTITVSSCTKMCTFNLQGSFLLGCSAVQFCTNVPTYCLHLEGGISVPFVCRTDGDSKFLSRIGTSVPEHRVTSQNTKTLIFTSVRISGLSKTPCKLYLLNRTYVFSSRAVITSRRKTKSLYPSCLSVQCLLSVKLQSHVTFNIYRVL